MARNNDPKRKWTEDRHRLPTICDSRSMNNWNRPWAC